MSAAKKETPNYEPMPKGDYLMALKTLTEKQTRKGDDMITAAFEVTEGEHQGRLVFENFLLTHDNPDVPEFSANKVTKFLKSVGVTGGFDELGHDYSKLEEYSGTPFIATIDYADPYTNRDGKLTIGNRIKAFKAS